jgi:hypothetical protein
MSSQSVEPLRTPPKFPRQLMADMHITKKERDQTQCPQLFLTVMTQKRLGYMLYQNE